MKDEEIKNGINELKKTTMTSLERSQIFENVLNNKNVEKEKPVKSPWIYSFGFFIQRNRVLSYSTLVLLFVVLGSGGFVSASQKSLPGMALYSLKVNLIEPAGSLLKLYPEEKAQYESNLATKRLVEAEVLARENKLDSTKETQINDLLTKHTVALNKAISLSEEDESGEKIYEIAINFQNEMNIHAEKLENTKNQGDIKKEKKTQQKIKKEIPVKSKEKIKEEAKEETPSQKIEQKKETSEVFKNSNLTIQPPTQLPSAGFQAGLTTDINMAPTTLSIPPIVNQEGITEIITEVKNEIKVEVIVEEEIKEEKYENEEMENFISQNARANAQIIKDALERKASKRYQRENKD